MGADYRVGSCYHCLVSIPVGSLFAWITVFIAVIGWSTSTWLSLSKLKELLKYLDRDVPLEYDEIVLIAIALATVFITVVYLIIATFSSQKMSRYTFSTSKKNTFGYCLSITVVVFSFLCVLFWTAIVGATMLPIAALSIIHILVRTGSLNCVHLESYGVGAMSNSTTVASSGDSPLLCDDDLDMWMADAWRAFVPLMVSIAFAVLIESAMLGFMIAASSNARHLKERMEYINEPYTYSTDNVNGNTKPPKDGGISTANNNQSDTQI